MNDGESLEECARRETREETGIVLGNITYRGIVFFLNEGRTLKNGKTMKINFKAHYYECSDFDSSRAEATEGKLAWVENDKVMDLEMHEGDKAIWDWLNKFRLFEGSIAQDKQRIRLAELHSYTPF